MTLHAILPADSINKTDLCNMHVYRVQSVIKNERNSFLITFQFLHLYYLACIFALLQLCLAPKTELFICSN